MPHTPELRILRAWRQTGEVGRIHYIVRTHDDGERRLYADESSGLGKVLNDALLAQGYNGPKSASEH